MPATGSQPSKEQVRAWLVQRGAAGLPPPPPAEVRAALGWQRPTPAPDRPWLWPVFPSWPLAWWWRGPLVWFRLPY